jgi:HAD superfamily hydrolase (TIGR01484 family)
MHCHALACDYDGTLATHGVVDSETIHSLRRWRDAGRKLLMVTGRQLSELQSVFSELPLFDYVVAENGGLLYVPSTDEQKPLAAVPPPEFLQELIARGVGPISVGQTIIATWQPHENTVLDTIREFGLDLQVIFNKGAVMILPTGVNKATGLAAALKAMELSRHEVAAIGDAENDHAFLKYSRYGIAVSNALPALKQHADWITDGDHGRGVQQLIDRLLADELADIRPKRHAITLPTMDGEPERRWFPGEEHLLFGSEQAQADTLTGELMLSLMQHGYQTCWFTCHGTVPQPKGTTHGMQQPLINIGSTDQLPSVDEVLQNLSCPDHSVRVVLCAHGPDDRRQRLGEICQQLATFEQERQRPHVVILPGQADSDAVRKLMPSFRSVVAVTGPLPEDSELRTTADVQYLEIADASAFAGKGGSL